MAERNWTSEPFVAWLTRFLAHRVGRAGCLANHMGRITDERIPPCYNLEEFLISGAVNFVESCGYLAFLVLLKKPKVCRETIDSSSAGMKIKSAESWQG